MGLFLGKVIPGWKLIMEQRTEALVARLEKGRSKTFEIFSSLTPEQWQVTVYPEPVWLVRNLLVHFVSAEEQLLALARDVAGGGPGAPPDLDINRYNADEQERFKDFSPSALLDMLEKYRRQTIEWVKTLTPEQLDRVGRHPVLGDLNVEAMLLAIYGHQLFHMRDLARALGTAS